MKAGTCTTCIDVTWYKYVYVERNSVFSGGSGDDVIVAPGASVDITCTGPDGEFAPTWLLNGKVAQPEGNCYRYNLRRTDGEINATAMLTINSSHTCGNFTICCRIRHSGTFLYLYNTTLIVQG